MIYPKRLTQLKPGVKFKSKYDIYTATSVIRSANCCGNTYFIVSVEGSTKNEVVVFAPNDYEYNLSIKIL